MGTLSAYLDCSFSSHVSMTFGLHDFLLQGEAPMVKERQVVVKLSEALKLEGYFSRQCRNCAGSSQIFGSNLLGVFQAHCLQSLVLACLATGLLVQ
jgi:hypothetical protein